jgi:hypothetical protein
LKTTPRDTVREREDKEVLAACRSLHLDRDETRSVLARLRSHRYILALVVAHGGTAMDFVRGHLEIRRLIRASGL